MNAYAIWPFFAILAIALLLVRSNRLFGVLDSPALGAPDRFTNIDGLRGLMAFGVFGHHAAVTYQYLFIGVWINPPSAFYTLIGETPVALFFAISGFLFWRKLLIEGRAIDWRKLYVGRLFRLAPVYLAAVSVLLLIIAARTGFQLREPPSEVAMDVGRWFFVGALGKPDVNGYDGTGTLMNGVTWTLRYLWLFYVSLPALAIFARKPWHSRFALAGFAALAVTYAIKPISLPMYENPFYEHVLYGSFFFSGMLAASLLHDGVAKRLFGTVGTAIALLSLLLLFAKFSTTKGALQIVLVSAFMLAISQRTALFGLLTAKPLRRLGAISYSVYLIHGLVLTTIFGTAAVKEFVIVSPERFWLVVGLAAIAVVTIASLTHLLIERPGISLGKRLLSRSGTRPMFANNVPVPESEQQR